MKELPERTALYVTHLEKSTLVYIPFHKEKTLNVHTEVLYTMNNQDQENDHEDKMILGLLSENLPTKCISPEKQNI